MANAQSVDTKLAVDGGAPVRERAFPRWPYYADDEIEAVTRVLRSGLVNYWTGSESRLFEEDYAKLLGRRHAIALANGTVALELALRALNVGDGDEVVVTSRSFMASASAIVLCGARPVFVDVDANSQNLTAATVEPALTSRTRALLVVHLAGWPCDMSPIMELAKDRGLLVIEDCAQAHGATYCGQPVGSFGHVAAFSFCQDKILSTGGEGGMLLTDDTEVWERAWAFKDHGKSYEAVHRRDHPEGFRWLHESIGTNWRITEGQSAIGRIQLRKLDDWIARRRSAASIFDDCFSALPGLRVVRPPAEVLHSYYKYFVFIEPDALQPGWDRQRVLSAIRAEGVPCFSGGCPEIYLEKAFPESLRPQHRLPTARLLGDTSLMFETHPRLSSNDLRDVCRVVEKVMLAATKS